nr:unnamed protein product [Callosobruchus analis]
MLTKHYRYYVGNSSEDIKRPAKSFKELTKVALCIWPNIAHFFIIIVSMICSGSVTYLVVSEYYGNGNAWNEKYFVPVVTFLIPDITGLAGKYLSRPIMTRKNAKWFILVTLVLRFIFVPLYFLCNAPTATERHIPILLPHDWQYIIIVVIDSTTMSILGGIVMLSMPNECLASVESKELTQRKACEKYGIQRRTIISQLRLLRSKIPSRPPGVPTTFSTEGEVLFVDCILRLSEYGFSLTVVDLYVVIQTYLDKTSRRASKFKENCPGTDWVSSCLKRHSCLSQRIVANIKRKTAAINKETITAYIQNLENVVRNVPSENIWNYDETNLSDDPGQKKVIAKRGAKYPKLISNSSKSSTFITFAGNAAGELLPP